MKFSYNWLQTYFEEKLPAPEKLEELLTFHLSEVESSEKVGSDYMLDVKTLADRNHYLLSHKGMALEVSALMGIPRILPKIEEVKEENIRASLSVSTPLCRRYIVRKIENVNVDDSPKWLKDRLEAVGQRSINSIVDATNYVMLDVGQPLHAFDADKVSKGIVIRNASKGETLETLDGKKVELSEEMVVEADEEKVLAIAGIKGGKFSGITSKTKDLIIIAGNFEASNIRKTATKIEIKTDASKRFENGLSPEAAAEGIRRLSTLLKELSPGAKFGPINDYYSSKPERVSFSVSLKEIDELLGISIPKKKAAEILKSLEIEVKEKGDTLSLLIPLYRHDLNSVKDVVDEVGRIYGYEKVKPELPKNKTFVPGVEKGFYYSQKIKNILRDQGFSEVITYALTSKGEFKIEKAVASDKNFLRENLTEGIAKSLDLNHKNSELLGLDEIKIFEIGKVFPKSGEHAALSIGIKNVKKKDISVNEKIRNIREHLLGALGSGLQTLCTVDDSGGLLMLKGKQIGIINSVDGVLELNLDSFIEPLPAPHSYNDLEFKKIDYPAFKPFSVYPYIVRDIALWAPEGSEKDIRKLIEKEGGELMIRLDLFDSFHKEGKTSYAFRMVFQAMDRTLEEKDASEIMERIYSKVKEKGWTVR